MDWTEWIVHKVLFWETDNVKKGHIVRAFHHAGSYSFITLIIISHTIYPAFWFQTVVLFAFLLIWAHHILTHGCILSKIEQKLIQDESSLVDPYFELFDIKTDEHSKQGILMLGSTILAGALSLEWVSRVFHKLIPFVQAQFQVASSVSHIPLLTSSP